MGGTDIGNLAGGTSLTKQSREEAGRGYARESSAKSQSPLPNPTWGQEPVTTCLAPAN